MSEKRVVIITVCVCSVLYSMYVHLNTQVFDTLASRIERITFTKVLYPSTYMKYFYFT